MAPIQKMKEESMSAFRRPRRSAMGQMRRHARKAPACWRPTARELTRVWWAVEYLKSDLKEGRVRTPPEGEY